LNLRKFSVGELFGLGQSENQSNESAVCRLAEDIDVIALAQYRIAGRRDYLAVAYDQED
jgi:hypothetical protein